MVAKSPSTTMMCLSRPQYQRCYFGSAPVSSCIPTGTDHRGPFKLKSDHYQLGCVAEHLGLDINNLNRENPQGEWFVSQSECNFALTKVLISDTTFLY